MADKIEVLNGRDAVNAYRQAHVGLYSWGWHKGISEEHTPLFSKLLDELRRVGFTSLKQFFVGSESLKDGWL